MGKVIPGVGEDAGDAGADGIILKADNDAEERSKGKNKQKSDTGPYCQLQLSLPEKQPVIPPAQLLFAEL